MSRSSLPPPLAAKKAGWESGWVRRPRRTGGGGTTLQTPPKSLGEFIFSRPRCRLFLFIILPRERKKKSAGGNADGGAGLQPPRARALAEARGRAGRRRLPAACRGRRSPPARAVRVCRALECELGMHGNEQTLSSLLLSALPPCLRGRARRQSRASRFLTRRSHPRPAELPLARRFPCGAAGAARGASESRSVLLSAVGCFQPEERRPRVRCIK